MSAVGWMQGSGADGRLRVICPCIVETQNLASTADGLGDHIILCSCDLPVGSYFSFASPKRKSNKRKRRLFLNRSAQKKGLGAGLLILTKCSAALTFSFASPKRKSNKKKRRWPLSRFARVGFGQDICLVYCRGKILRLRRMGNDSFSVRVICLCNLSGCSYFFFCFAKKKK